ncbi:SoxR reducing system RseC family protein [Thiomicrospira sp. WB1]|uniref:SoxR reducing system RseC family protein n=1 Tax=Thiomicrospira sp. WB1 TaxID=1685380 RepID=UPI000747011D|nr:SoxR reducing system RseC family protein [Thiomicrospira sp. WB1]KUJ71881.1 hypothetical protein AVO41_05340 [Thiomicrospira sp. WB1]
MNATDPHNPTDSSETVLAEGDVIELKGDQALVRTMSQSGCDSCQSQGTCGTGVLTQWLVPKAQNEIWVDNTLDVGLHDRVRLSMKKSELIKHSLMGYGLPLMGLFLGAALAQVIWPTSDATTEALTAGLAFAGLIVGWWWPRNFWTPQKPVLHQRISKET